MATTPDFDDLVHNINTCTLCSLHKNRTNAVPGEGSQTANIVFIGEGPGFYEDKSGHPFVGPAGHLLDDMLASINLKREDVYITNMVKCRPDDNRDPLPEEIQACRPYLQKQLELISPKVVVTLGRHSFSKFFPGESISQARGKPRKWNNITIYPMYHPAAALHNGALRPVIQSDFKKLSSLINGENETPEQDQTNQSQQLSLFE